MTLWNLARCAPRRWRAGESKCHLPEGRTQGARLDFVGKPGCGAFGRIYAQPGCAGVIRETQQRNLAKTPQFVTMSSFDNPRLENELMSSGAAYYFLKPFDADYMADRICSLCSESPVPAQLMRLDRSIPPSRI